MRREAGRFGGHTGRMAGERRSLLADDCMNVRHDGGKNEAVVSW